MGFFTNSPSTQQEMAIRLSSELRKVKVVRKRSDAPAQLHSNLVILPQGHWLGAKLYFNVDTVWQYLPRRLLAVFKSSLKSLAITLSSSFMFGLEGGELSIHSTSLTLKRFEQDSCQMLDDSGTIAWNWEEILYKWMVTCLHLHDNDVISGQFFLFVLLQSSSGHGWIKPSSLMSTGCVVPLRHFLPRWLRMGWQSLISQGKIPWNSPPWLGIEPVAKLQ